MNNYVSKAKTHLENLVTHGTAEYGPDPTAMWMSSIDINTKKYPLDDSRPTHIGKRVYRNIDAPQGCSLYWISLVL